MRVLHVTPSFYPAHGYGGPIASLYQLTLAQARRGKELRVLTTDLDGTGGCLPRRLSGRWVEEFGVPTWYARTVTLRRPRALEDLSPALALPLPRWLRWADLCHVTAVFSPSSLLGISAALALQRPLVVSPRGSLLPFALQQGSPHKRAALALLRPVLQRVHGWHVTSEEEAAGLRAQGLVGARAAVRVVGNGVAIEATDPRRAPPALKTAAAAPAPVLDALRQQGAGPLIAMLGRVEPIKDIPLAIAALAQLSQRLGHGRARLLLIGPDRHGHGEELRAQAARLGVAEQLRFTGLVTGADKSALLRGCDQLWLCSRMESFGNVVLEALAVGTPVVAVQRTPWALLEEAQVGHHVPADPAAIAAAAAALWQRTPAEREALRRRALTTVRERFSWTAVEDQMEVLYRAALVRRGAALRARR